MWRKDNRPTYIRRSIFALLIVIAALMQNVRGGFPSFFGSHALLLIPITVTIAMFERGAAGIGFGLFAGLLCEVCSSGGDGLSAVYLTAVGFICGTLITYYMRNNLVTALVLTGGVCLIGAFLHWLIFVVRLGVDGAAYVLVRFYLCSVLYTVFFTPACYFTVMKLSEKIRKERRTFAF